MLSKSCHWYPILVMGVLLLSAVIATDIDWKEQKADIERTVEQFQEDSSTATISTSGSTLATNPTDKNDPVSTTPTLESGSSSTVTPVPASCICGAGIPSISNLSKIVGGISSGNGAWPWMGIIVTGNGALCGGSLINNQFILTAGHCVASLSPTQIGSSFVILGRNRIITNTTNRAIRRISSVMVHPKYDASGPAPYHDIALIKLAAPVLFTDRINPVCLSQAGAPFNEREALVAGWGKVNETSAPSNTLREAKVKVVSNEECNASYPFIIKPTHICTYRPEHDACNGDSGGPLIVRKTEPGAGEEEMEYFTQIGVVSFGRGCGQVGSPGVYTRVEKYLNWIRARTKGASHCANTFE